MARRLEGVILVAVAAVVAALLSGSKAQAPAPPPEHPKGAVTYTVGGTMGWTKPAGGAAAYQAWSSNNMFEIRDILVFNFNNGAHDVAEVTKAAFDSCNGANTLSITTVPPARMNLTTAGQHFFICTVPGHCSSGQKVAIDVTSASPSATPPPSSSAAPTPKAATPPPSSSAAPTPKAATPPPSSSAAPTPKAATPASSSAAAPTLSPSASTPSSSAAAPRTSAVTPAPSTASLPPKAATPSPSAALPPSSTAAPPSSTLAPSVATSPAGVATPPRPGNSAASLGLTGVSAVILIAAIALFTFP